MDNLQFIKENPHKYGNSCPIQELETLLANASNAYHNSDTCIISDIVYDILIDILQERNSSSHVLSNVGFTINDDNKIKLPYYMGSADKIKKKEKIISWVEKYNTNSNLSVSDSNGDVVISCKLDGISGLYVYNPSQNPQAKLYTRGDGNYGKDISHLLTHINMPKLSAPIAVRGELIISRKNYAENENPYTTIRSMVNGITNAKTISPFCKLLDFVVFDILDRQIVPEEKFKLANSLGFKVPLWKTCSFTDILKNYNQDQDNYLFDTLSVYRKENPFEIDGIILTHNQYYPNIDQGNPKHSVAYKNNSEGKVTTVKEIVWNITKYGVLIPTIYFNKINLGSNINKCTGFNARYIFNNSLGRGAKLRVVLSGEVIPYIVEIISQAPGPDMPNIKYKWDANRVHCLALELTNENLGKRLTNFIKCVDIDNLSDGLIQKLIANQYNTIDKILKIKVEDLMSLGGFQQTLAEKIYNNIHKVIDNPIYLPKIMSGSLLFQHGFSIKRFEKILAIYPDIINKDITIEDIVKIPGFQVKTASQFVKNLGSFKTFLSEHSYLKYYVTHQSQSSQSILVDQKLKNIHIVITGGKPSDIIEFINKHGGIIQSNINSKTQLLIIKDETIKNNKTMVAQEKNINILTQKAFRNTYITQT